MTSVQREIAFIDRNVNDLPEMLRSVNCSTHPIFKIEHNEQSLVPFAQKNNMDNAKYCRLQAQECRRLLRLPQSEAAAQVLKNLCHSWIRLANQADLYAGIVRRQSSSANGQTECKRCSAATFRMTR